MGWTLEFGAWLHHFRAAGCSKELQVRSDESADLNGAALLSVLGRPAAQLISFRFPLSHRDMFYYLRTKLVGAVGLGGEGDERNGNERNQVSRRGERRAIGVGAQQAEHLAAE